VAYLTLDGLAEEDVVEGMLNSIHQDQHTMFNAKQFVCNVHNEERGACGHG